MAYRIQFLHKTILMAAEQSQDLRHSQKFKTETNFSDDHFSTAGQLLYFILLTLTSTFICSLFPWYDYIMSATTNHNT